MAPSKVIPTADKGLIVTFGEILVDFVPTVSGASLADARGFVKTPSGSAANVAIGVSRLGGKAAFVGKLGSDEFGRMLSHILYKNDVSANGVVWDRNAPTAMAFATVRADGERELASYRNPSADMLLRSDELNLDLIKSAKVFHYGSTSLAVEPCRSAHMKAMKVAKEAGALLSFDPKIRLSMWASPEEARKQILSVWDKADLIKINESELRFLTGSDNIDAAAMSLVHDKLKLLVVTLGCHGCRYYTKSFQGSVEPVRVKAVDTAGAGDSFVAALLTNIVDHHQSILEEYKDNIQVISVCDSFSFLIYNDDERKLKEVLKFSNACGAITTTKKGAIQALPTQKKMQSHQFWSRFKWDSLFLVSALQFGVFFLLLR